MQELRIERIRLTWVELNVPDAPSGCRGALTSMAVPEAWFDRLVLPEMTR
ncbi:hypothetical protein N798_02990 [Knoellia flava TL1]|uniref:Uncharacterized protein n=1 Tax=Knoellia flava TL1 TaxID=1385518 RepID=A0ABR4XHX2_9MICO|nr:hypothetical protein N798_02990 [Knoellia flava TL1]